MNFRSEFNPHQLHPVGALYTRTAEDRNLGTNIHIVSLLTSGMHQQGA